LVVSAKVPEVRLGGRYQLEDRIAAGSTGEVWRGVDTVLGRPVAVRPPGGRAGPALVASVGAGRSGSSAATWSSSEIHWPVSWSLIVAHHASRRSQSPGLAGRPRSGNAVAARARSIACRSWPTDGAPDGWPFSSRYSRHDMLGACPGSANGSTPSISNVGEPRMPNLAASPSSDITSCDNESPARSSRTASSRCWSTGALGQPGTPRTVRSSCRVPVVCLPGQVPVQPLQRRAYHRPLMPASLHDLPADRLGGTAQRLAHRGGLPVPGPAAQKMDAADADADFRMVTEVDQGVLRPGLAAAPASALVGLAFRCLSFSAHGGSRLLPASVGAPRSAPF
jgi:hypothetical protein